LIVLVAGCAGQEPPPSDTAAPGVVCAGQPGGRVGECPGDFTLPLANGGAFTLADHAGQVVVVHLAEGNAVDEGAAVFLDDQLAAQPDVTGLVVLAGASADAAAWGEALGLSLPVAFDEGGTFSADWGRTSLFPTLLVLDGTRQVTARIHEQYETQLPAALGAR
jgi:hypothetical protein